MRKFIADIKNRDFLLLWWAQIISQFGDRINQMALIGLTAGRTPGSAIELAKLLSFTIIPVFIVGPIAGVWVDRWDRRTTLFVCDLLRGLLVLTIPLVFIARHSMIPIYAVVFLAFCLSRFYVPAKMSIIPDLVGERDILIANSLVSMTGMIAFVLGCALGGFIVEKVGPAGGFVWDAATFFISGLLVFLMKPRLEIRVAKERFFAAGKEVLVAIRASVLTEMKEGIKYLLNHKEIRFIMNMLFILFAAAGAIYVVIILFVQEAFHSVTRHLGVLAVCLGLGLFLGAVSYGKWGGEHSPFKAIFFCLLSGGVILIAFASVVYSTRNIWVATSLAVGLGLVVGPIVIAANTLVHQVSNHEMRGKVFSALEIVSHSAFLMAMFISSVLAEHVQKYWILVSIGLIFSLIGLVGFLTLRRDRSE